MYNLFISGRDDAWDQPDYIIERDRFLEHTDDAIAATFKELDDNAIANLKAFPCLFMYEKGINKKARVGRLKRIQRYQKDVRVSYQFDDLIPLIDAQKIEEMAWDLDIGKTEVYRTHWALKEVDLLGVLKDKGIIASIPKAPEIRPKTVFITYSWDSEEHKVWVKTLAERLTSNGVPRNLTCFSGK